MSWDCHRTPQYGGSAPATLGFSAVAPEWLSNGAASAAPAIPAAESTLGSHPCVALSSAQVLPEWINRNLAGNRFAANGDNPLNFVSQPRGSLQIGGSSWQTVLSGTAIGLLGRRGTHQADALTRRQSWRSCGLGSWTFMRCPLCAAAGTGCAPKCRRRTAGSAGTACR